MNINNDRAEEAATSSSTSSTSVAPRADNGQQATSSAYNRSLSQFVNNSGASLANLLQQQNLNDIINISQQVTQSLELNSDQQYQPMFRNNSSNNASSNHGHSHAHTHSHSHQALQDPNDISGSSVNDSDQQVILNLAEGSQNGAHQDQQDGHLDANGANSFFQLMIKAMQTSLPFFLILIAKIFHEHLLGFFIVLGFMTTLHWSNRTLIDQVQLKEKKQNHKLILLIVFLLTNVIIFFLIFKESKLENCLIFLPTNIHKMDTWNLIWIVVCSDTIVKFLIISLKAFVTLLPFNVIPLRKRGNFYSSIETFALFYRTLIPIHPWILFLMYNDTSILDKLLESSHDPTGLLANDTGDKKTDNPNSLLANGIDQTHQSKAFPLFLCILYIVFKLNQIYNGFNELMHSVQELMLDMTYGSPVTINENDENICPICQDKYKKPVILKCKHTFCEDCVCVWLDKENSCPMCRARVTVKKPKFKDGSTTILIQWF